MREHWRLECRDGYRGNYVRCESCRLIRLQLDPDSAAREKASYADDYYGGGFSKFDGAIQTLREVSAGRRARELNRFFPQPGRVVDIGCGEGLFLESMKNLGWTVEGCEIGKRAADRAEERLSQPIHRGQFETLPRKKQPWDVVMLWHVLEHVENPELLLQDIAADVPDNGLMVIGIPNAASWQASLFGPHWFHLDPPRHLYSLRLEHLRSLAERAGWEVTDVRHFSLEYNPYGWAQSFLNSLGWRRDAMYETLKRNDRLVEGKTALRLLAWMLLGPAIVPAVLEALVRRGGTINVYLRKRKK